MEYEIGDLVSHPMLGSTLMLIQSKESIPQSGSAEVLVCVKQGFAGQARLFSYDTNIELVWSSVKEEEVQSDEHRNN